MNIVHIVIARRTNLKLLLILLCICLTSVIILISYQLSQAPSYAKTLPEGKIKLDIHHEQFDSEDETLSLGTEVHDSVVALETDLHGSSDNGSSGRPKSIAIGCAITSHNEDHLSLENVAYKLPFLRTLVPSFCKTSSPGYEYHFYTAFDLRDPHFIKEQFMEVIYERFSEIVSLLCPKKSKVSLHFVQCNHNHNPTWAQNDAMIEAYLDNIEYYYRLNDDTLMLTPGWTEVFIDGLKGFSPPNVGVVGPLHKGGNEEILTYDFVHRTHIDIFGYYYPRVFTDWWADNWMTQVYGQSRMLKLPGVRLIHTGEVGTRYEVRPGKQRFLEQQVRDDQTILQRYLEGLENSQSKKPSVIKKVVSMSLWGSSTRYTFGALRNAQLMPIYFPGWTLRFYVEKPRDDGSTVFSPVSDRILLKLAKLGAEIMRVDAERSHIPPMMWRFLVADDLSVDLFIVRDADCRLHDRDAIVVGEWIASKTAFHCIRDHPSHAAYPILGGLWGGMPRKLHEIMPVPWRELMMGIRSDYSEDMSFLASAIWPRVQDFAFCHDSVSCTKWANSHPFPVARIGTEHLGQVFDAFGNARDNDIQILLENRPPSECTVLLQPRVADLLEIATTKSIFTDDSFQTLKLSNSNKTTVFPFSKLNSVLENAMPGIKPLLFPKTNNSLVDFGKHLLTGDHKTQQDLPLNLERMTIFKNTSMKDIDAYNISSEGVSFTDHASFQNKSRSSLKPTISNKSELYPNEKYDSVLRLFTLNMLANFKSTYDMSVDSNTDRSKSNGSVFSEGTSVVVWSMDYSIFPLKVIKNSIANNVKFIDKSLASNCKETKTCARNIRVITKKNGLNLTRELIRKFHEEYESDPEMNLVTHFLCTYPVSLCELYAEFERPLILYISSRYEHGKYTPAKWNKWNIFLKNAADNKHNSILASNAYDAMYLQYFTGIEAPVVPLQCEYVGVTYRPTLSRILLSVTQFPAFEEFFLHEFQAAKRNSSVKYEILSSSDFLLWKNFAVVASHFAIIHIPCDAVSELFCEHYAMHIPLFIPTVELVIKWHFQFDILDKFTWNSIRELLGIKSDRSPLLPANGMDKIPDPNQSHNKTSLNYWLKLSVFYQAPYVIYFNSFLDLVTKLQQTNIMDISAKMAKEDDRIKITAAKEWIKILQKL